MESDNSTTARRKTKGGQGPRNMEGESGKSPRLQVRLPQSTFLKIEAEAHRNGLTKSEFARELIEEALRNREK